MAAIAQAAADAARSALPRLRRATAVLAEELDASRAPPDHAPSRPAGSHPEPAGPETARAPVDPAGRAHLGDRCWGRWRYQAPVLVPIVATVLVAVLAGVLVAVFVAVLAALLAAVMVAVAPVTVTRSVSILATSCHFLRYWRPYCAASLLLGTQSIG